MLANLLLSLLSVWTLAIPSVQLLPFTTDLNRNGIPETLVVITGVSDKFTTPCPLYTIQVLEDGQPTSYQKNRIYFDIVSGPMHENFNALEINTFMEEINLLLADSIPLINSDEPLLETFEKKWLPAG